MRRRRFRKGIAPLVVVFLAIAAVATAVTVSYLRTQGIEVPIESSAIYNNTLLINASTEYIFTGTAANWLINAYINESILNTSPSGYYHLWLVDINASEVRTRWPNNEDPHFIGEVDATAIDEAHRHLLIIYMDGQIDAINMTFNETARTWCYNHSDPTPWLDLLTTKELYWDILAKYLQSFWGLVSGVMNAALAAAVTFIPLALPIFIISFISSVFKAIKELSMEPIFNYFMTIYNIAFKVVSKVVDIIMKIIDLISPT